MVYDLLRYCNSVQRRPFQAKRPNVWQARSASVCRWKSGKFTMEKILARARRYSVWVTTVTVRGHGIDLQLRGTRFVPQPAHRLRWQWLLQLSSLSSDNCYLSNATPPCFKTPSLFSLLNNYCSLYSVVKESAAHCYEFTSKKSWESSSLGNVSCDPLNPSYRT